MHRFRVLFVARAVSNLGNGIGPIALSFGVLALPDGSPTALSVVLAATAIPVILTLPFGGVIADRIGRARVIGFSDVILSAVVVTSGLLFVTGQATVPLIAVLGAVSGFLNGLWYPAFAGIVPDVVPEEHLQSGNAFVSVASNGGLIMGTAVGGILVSLVGSGWAIILDGVTFLVAGVLVFSLRSANRPGSSGDSVIADLTSGWRTFLSYRWVVAIVCAFSIFVLVLRGSEEVLGPVLANEVYDGPRGWSAVMAAQAIGLLIGAMLASRIRPTRPLIVGLAVSAVFPVFLLTLALASPLPIVIACSFLWGIAIEFFMVLWMTVMQANIPRESLSRVSSYDALGSLMFGPIGLALAGPMVALIGLETAFLVAAAVALVALALPLLVRSVWTVTTAGPAPATPSEDASTSSSGSTGHTAA